MTRAFRAEAYKLITLRSNYGALAGMGGLVCLAVLVHVFGLPVGQLADGATQRGLFVDVGVNIGMLFAGLLGALSISSEYRTGTIRPTLLATPRRTVVLAAKALVLLPAGAMTGLLAAACAVGVGSIALRARDLSLELSGADITRLLSGAMAGGALWAMLGLGVAAVVRSQVPTLVGLFAWVLFIENVLAELPSLHRFLPGASASALAGQTGDGVLAAGSAAGVLLLAYAVLVAGAGALATEQRDIA